jgi:trimeric autotransporter adhesin
MNQLIRYSCLMKSLIAPILLLVLCAAVSLNSQVTVPLAKLLNSDGSIDLKRVKNGMSIDARGYSVSPTHDVLKQTPRFVKIDNVGYKSELNNAPTIAVKTPNGITSNPDDALWDSQFGPAGNEQIQVNAIAVSGDKIIIGGFFRTFLGIANCNSLVVWNAGVWDAVIEFGVRTAGDGTGIVNTLAADDKGNVYIGGSFAKVGGDIQASGAFVWKADGTFSAIDIDILGSVNAIDVDGQNVYLGGNFTVATNSAIKNIAVWNGSKLNSLKTGIQQGTVSAIYSDNTNVYLGGNFKSVDGVNSPSIIAWNKQTQEWRALGSGLSNSGSQSSYVYAITSTPDGKLLVGGDFSLAGTINIDNLALWNGSTWTEFGGGADGQVNSITYIGDNLFVSGGFETIGQLKTFAIARWDGTKWNSVDGDKINGTANVLATFNGKLLAGGTFDIQINDTYVVRGVALWDELSWSSIGGNKGNGVDGPILGFIKTADNTFFAIGGFQNTGGVASPGISSFNGFDWKGINNVPFGGGNFIYGTSKGNKILLAAVFNRANIISGAGIALYDHNDPDTTTNFKVLATVQGTFNARSVNSMLVDGETIYVGGAFRVLNTDSVRCIAKYDGTTWSKMGSGMTATGTNAVVRSIIKVGTSIYAAGTFTTAGGTSVNNIAEWDGTEWKDVAGGLTATGSVSVNSMVVIGNELYVGGRFASAGTVSSANIAKYNLTTKTWSAVGNSGANGEVTSIISDGSIMVIAGDFTSIAGNSYNRIARFDVSNNTWRGFGSGVSGRVLTLAEADGSIYAGGLFNSAGGKSSLNIARWRQGISSVENQESVIPTVLNADVFPNPTSSSITMSFTLASAGMVTIDICDVLGNVVTSLGNEYRTEGNHTISWNSGDSAPGMYVAHLQSRNTITTRKIMVTR